MAILRLLDRSSNPMMVTLEGPVPLVGSEIFLQFKEDPYKVHTGQRVYVYKVTKVTYSSSIPAPTGKDREYPKLQVDVELKEITTTSF